MIPVLGTSSGEGIGYPLQYFGAALVARLVKNPPAMQETWVGSLGWEDPLEKGKTTHSSILAWRIPWPNRNHGLYRNIQCQYPTHQIYNLSYQSSENISSFHLEIMK